MAYKHTQIELLDTNTGDKILNMQNAAKNLEYQLQLTANFLEGMKEKSEKAKESLEKILKSL